MFQQFQSTLIAGFNPILLTNKLDDVPIWQEGSLNILETLINDKSLNTEFLRDESDVISPFIDKPANFLLLLLPLLVYYHDDLLMLNQILEKMITDYKLSSLHKEGLNLFARAIALAFRKKLDLAFFISQVRQIDDQLTLFSYLNEIEKGLSEGITLNQFIQELSKKIPYQMSPIISSLFCFFDTFDHPHLSLLRAAQCSSPRVTLGLTGALVGANGGFNQLPHLWRVKSLKLAQEVGLSDKINLLWQHWTGNLSNTLEFSVAVPLVMQPRPPFQLISQE